MIQYIKDKTAKIFNEKSKVKTRYIKNSCDTYNAYLISNHFAHQNETVFVVLANLYEAQKYYDLLSQIE
jgi:transcription-repair coupling factor (superfamily II helicase)